MEEKNFENLLDEELNKLLENELYWLFNFNTREKPNEAQIKHNEEMAQNIKKKIEGKYPSINMDIDFIKEIGIQYAKYKHNKEQLKSLEQEKEKHRKDVEKYPDWMSSGSVLEVVTSYNLSKREEEIKKGSVPSPIPTLKTIIAASKVDAENLDINLLEYLRNNNWTGKFTNPLLQTTYELYCDGKEKDLKIESLQSEKTNLLQENEEKDKEIRNLSEEKRKLEQQLEQQVFDSSEKYSDINNKNIELKRQVNYLQKMLSKTLDFCNHVRNSRFGKIFFKKQIRELPAPDDDEKEIEL